MRIGIDSTPLLIRSAGVKNYLYRWIASLRDAASSDKIEAFPFLRSLGPLDHEHSVVERIPTFWRLLLLHLANTAGTPILDPLTSRYDVFHVSNLIRRRPLRTLVTATVYDFTCRLMPQFHTAANIEADRLLDENIFAKADGLIAISENTRADAVRFLGIPADRISVIYPGVPDDFFHAAPTKSGKPYILSLGTIEPRKNIDTLLDAWLALSPSIRDEYELVIAGPVGWSSDNTMARIRGGVPGVRHLGYVPESDLPGLTAGATLLAYPSLYEGFGFPVAQAMAAGVPIVTSNVSCLPEVAGDGALLVDPRSVEELSAALDRLLTSPSLRKTLGERGAVRAERYRWSVCARESLDFFHRL